MGGPGTLTTVLTEQIINTGRAMTLNDPHFVAKHLDKEYTYSSFDQAQSFLGVYSIDSIFTLATKKKSLIRYAYI